MALQKKGCPYLNVQYKSTTSLKLLRLVMVPPLASTECIMCQIPASEVFTHTLLTLWASVVKLWASSVESTFIDAWAQLARAHALYFEFVIAQRQPVRENHGFLPSSVRYAGMASFGLWTLVVVCGRLIPYLPA